MASAVVHNILVNLKADSWQSTYTLYRSMLTSTLLYTSSIWGLNYVDDLEKVQTEFFKKYLALPRPTPGYAVRLELGINHVLLDIVKQAISWLIKMLKMENDRLPKICFNRLLHLDNNDYGSSVFNWVSQLRAVTDGTIDPSLWDQPTAQAWSSSKDVICERLQLKLKNQDLRRYTNSECLTIKVPRGPDDNYESYYPNRIPIDFVRVKAQVRLHCNFSTRFSINKTLFQINSQNCCPLCYSREPDTLPHMLLYCPHYLDLRRKYLLPLFDLERPPEISFAQILCSNEVQSIKNLYRFLSGAFHLRLLSESF